MNEETKKLKKINHVLKSLIKEGNIKSLRLLDDEEFYSVVAEVTYPYSINPEIVENIIENFLEKVNNEWIRIDKDISYIDLIFIEEMEKLNESVSTKRKKITENEIMILEKMLNKFMPNYFEWWVNCKITFCDYSKVFDTIILETELKVLDEWAYESFREYYNTTNFPNIPEDELVLEEIIGSKLSKDINEKIKAIIQSVLGEIVEVLIFDAVIVELVERDNVPDKILDEQLTKPNNNSILKDYKKIIFTGNTHQELGLSRIETPQSLLDKINKNFSVPVFRINSAGYDFPVYRLEGKFEHNGKKYTIDLRPEKGPNFALIGTIKIPIN